MNVCLPWKGTHKPTDEDILNVKPEDMSDEDLHRLAIEVGLTSHGTREAILAELQRWCI